MALLREYARDGSEAAFAELVARRLGFVYSAALRQVGQEDLAGEITQAVFVLLAQKAARIPERTILSGWLFRATRYVALAQIRAAARRRQLTEELIMQTEPATAARDPLGEQLSPLLDEALAALGDQDRQAVLLRYIENKSLAEVGTALGLGEDTARKRTARALEKLHRYFRRRGISSTTALIAGAISANSLQAVPPALAKTVLAAAVAKGTAASASTLTLIHGALKIMAWTKIKTAIIVGAAVVLSAGGIAAVETEIHGQTESREKLVLQKIIEANRYWLLAPPDSVTNYTYAFHLDWSKAPGGVWHTTVRVYRHYPVTAEARQAITYSSALQQLARHPDQVRVQGLREEGGKIRLSLEFLPVPGAKTFQVVDGKKIPIPPLAIACGNGIRQYWRGEFETGGTNAELVVDAEKMVPLTSVVPVEEGTVEETFTNYSEVSPGSYVPLSVAIKYSGLPAGMGTMDFDWQFKLHDGIWLLDESNYRGKKVAWTDQVTVDQP